MLLVEQECCTYSLALLFTLKGNTILYLASKGNPKHHPDVPILQRKLCVLRERKEKEKKKLKASLKSPVITGSHVHSG